MKNIKRFCLNFFVGLVILFCLIKTSWAQQAPDSSLMGPYPVGTIQYRMPPSRDRDVLDDRVTEIWGKIFYPKDQHAQTSLITTTGRRPLIVILHGNHGTCGEYVNGRRIDNLCTYTDTGSCPKGYIPTPNHEGYDYLAINLASWGFIVASINANRGINCGAGVEGDWGLNLARGRLVLKHLNLLYQWSTLGGAPVEKNKDPNFLFNKIDFESVGLLGHSRGGEGVRAAYNLYFDKDSPWPKKIPGLKIKAIFEIGAVDGQTSRVLNADGTVWNQLLPLCDGDVSNLEGRFPFERMLANSHELAHAQKSLYEVWGANHNFFNTEWQKSDATHCGYGLPIFDKKASGSLKQQQIALASVPAFFRSWLGTFSDAAYNQNFNPLHALPAIVTKTTQVDRDFTPSPGMTETQIVDDFDQETGTSSSLNKNRFSQIKINNIYLKNKQRAAKIYWDRSSPDTFFEAIWAREGKGRDIHDYVTLDFRIRRTGESPGKTAVTNFSIALEDAAGLLSKAVEVKDYTLINGPGNVNPVLKTVRIPLSAFQEVDVTHIHGVRFIFNKTQKDAIYLANIRMHRQFGLGELRLAKKKLYTYAYPVRMSRSLQYVPVHMNKISKIQRLAKASVLSGKPAVEISFASLVPFPVLNRLPILKIGDKTFKLSHYANSSDLREMIFTLTYEEFNCLSKESEITIDDGKIWQFGTLAKHV